MIEMEEVYIMRIFVNTILIILLFMFTSCANNPPAKLNVQDSNTEVVEEENLKECKGEIINNSDFLVSLLFTPLDEDKKPIAKARYFIWINERSSIDVSIIKDNYVITSQPEDPKTKEFGDVRENWLLLKDMDDCTFDITILIQDNRDKEEYKKGNKRVCVIVKELCYE
jgi:hypothetical protein